MIRRGLGSQPDGRRRRRRCRSARRGDVRGVRWLVIAAAAAHFIQCTSVHSDKAYGNTRRLHFACEAPSSPAARQGLPDRVHNTL